jgi:hypothetical protein
MWILIRREPHPDAHVWQGRRQLAVVDAVVWPALWMTVCMAHVHDGGLIAAFGFAVSVLSCVSRLRRAWWVNHRYRFTTWRWGRVLGTVWLLGVLIEFALVR